MMATAPTGTLDDSGGSTWMTGSSDGSSSTEPADGESTTSPEDTEGVPAGVLLRTTFTIPADTVVEEFSFTAPVQLPPTMLSGETLVLAVRDLSHPERDQAVLCPGSHPLDGCATVDYGAFGTPHDNRVTFEGPRGPWSIHFYKDRSIQLEPEPLPFNE